MIRFNERYRLAVKFLEIREGTSIISNGEMVRRVAAETGGESLTPSSASRWKSKSVPDLAILGAIARVCGVHPGWLAFGEAGGPPPDFVNLRQASTRLSAGDGGGDQGIRRVARSDEQTISLD